LQKSDNMAKTPRIKSIADSVAALTTSTSSIIASAAENIKDFQWFAIDSIKLPASTIAIGGTLYSAGDLIFSFANGTGDNGLDTGVEAPNQWYALYAVPGIGSAYVLKATTRHPITDPGPAGYPQYRYLGLFKNGQDLSSGQNDIARFHKSGDVTKFWNPSNGNMTGIRYAGSSGPVTSFTNNIFPVYGMSGGSGINLPFNGAFYGWTLTHVPSGGSAVLAAGTARFYDGSFATTGTVTFATGNAGAAANAGYGEIWCDSTTVTAISSASTIVLTSGQMNWSLNLNTIFDPLLARKIN